ncbi:hypothetical protein [Sulfurimonas sp.]|uniref:hypothetical protein n=1 Tax=Sulfurimonas sp. TaxID=2022749 RepID=UPI002B45D405|nr:hypothetical protein [Sulfurimonas sp.]
MKNPEIEKSIKTGNFHTNNHDLGTADETIMHYTWVRTRHLIKKSQLHIFGGYGHWTQIEHKAS